MPNMSYCRFENTEKDLEDCLIELEDQCEEDVVAFAKGLSTSERRALKRLINRARAIVELDDEHGLLEELEAVKEKP